MAKKNLKDRIKFLIRMIIQLYPDKPNIIIRVFISEERREEKQRQRRCDDGRKDQCNRFM
jgi:hypothetical protein